MVTLRTSSMDMEDHAGGRARKMPRGPPDDGMGMPPIAMTAGPPRVRVGPPMGVGPPLPPGAVAGPRTTATSRRGGRTRARSPLVAVGGGAVAVAGRRPGSTTPPGSRPGSASIDRRVMHVKAENPSSAAAAAAAAAKAFSDSNNGGHPAMGRSGQWSDRHHDERYHQMPPGYGEKSPYARGPRKWPPNPHDDAKMAHYSQHTYGPYGSPYEGYLPSGYGDRRYRGPPPHHHQYKEMRGMMQDRGHRGGVPDPGRGGSMYHHHVEYHHRTYLRGGGVDDRRPLPVHPPPASAPAPSSKMSRSPAHPGANASTPVSGGGTSLVIGGTTPIHVPKPDIHPVAERPTRALTRSVFRGCDNPESTHPAEENSDDSNQKMIHSFKTPTTSFEEKKIDETKRPASSGPPVSPKDPPQLHSTTQQRSADVFERSPEGNKNMPSIDIAPSFTLFNQSFDSLGENYLNVESTLHESDSFGMMPTASNGGDPDGMTNVLRRAFSGGNGSTTQLLAPSGSGHLTIGYSPVNSFGTAPPPRREGPGGNMMLLGGPEGRSSSPTQVFSAYHGYGNGRSGPLDDSHLRMSVGSFGALSNGRAGPYGEPVPPHYGYNGSFGGPPEKDRDDMSPHFYIFLKKYKLAFAGCAFLLPGLKAALLETTKNKNKADADSTESIGGKKDSPPRFQHNGEPTPGDLVIARRRVESSVCAFGGNCSGKESSPVPNESGSNSKTQGSSIFREREKSSTEEPTATVTPSSSVASPPRQSSNTKQKAKYEEELPGRYYENDSRLSWEFEENPPVEVSQGQGEQKNGKSNQDKREISKSTDDASAASKRLGASSPPASKMRYRCKLCGQPKQNHTCPYQQSLARSIGVMVYPAINAFTAAEPGSIAPALSEMNNFTDLSEKGSVANESSPGRSGIPLTSPKQVTPDTARPSSRQLQIGSPPTTPGRTPTRSNTGADRRNVPAGGQKRPHGYDGRVADDHGDLLFVEAMELKPQQFLTVSENPVLNNSDAFSYLALPLPYAQRKRLSDTLFSLSNEVPKLTDECAQVLREAREKDRWDLAVAELMTQVIVVLHCRDGDHRFEGLRQYLLTLGIAC